MDGKIAHGGGAPSVHIKNRTRQAQIAKPTPDNGEVPVRGARVRSRGRQA